MTSEAISDIFMCLCAFSTPFCALYSGSLILGGICRKSYPKSIYRLFSNYGSNYRYQFYISLNYRWFWGIIGNIIVIENSRKIIKKSSLSKNLTYRSPFLGGRHVPNIGEQSAGNESLFLRIREKVKIGGYKLCLDFFVKLFAIFFFENGCFHVNLLSPSIFGTKTKGTFYQTYHFSKMGPSPKMNNSSTCHQFSSDANQIIQTCKNA